MPLYRYIGGQVKQLPLGPPAVVSTPPAPVSSGTTLLSSTLESATLRNPISDADMFSFLGENSYGSTSNWARSSVVQTDGPGGITSKVLNQHFTAGKYVDDGDSITLGTAPLPGGWTGNEASIEYDLRWVTGGSFGMGGKLPGLGGILSGHGATPSGGNPSTYGWSGRAMFITPAAGYSSENPKSPAEIIGYVYDPLQLQDNHPYGRNRRTGLGIVIGQWYHLKQYYRMNTVTTEGSLSNPADGVHRIWIDGVLRYENLAQLWRIYAAANITNLVFDCFYGGGDNTWAPTSNTDIQFDNFTITTP